MVVPVLLAPSNPDGLLYFSLLLRKLFTVIPLPKAYYSLPWDAMHLFEAFPHLLHPSSARKTCFIHYSRVNSMKELLYTASTKLNKCILKFSTLFFFVFYPGKVGYEYFVAFWMTVHSKASIVECKLSPTGLFGKCFLVAGKFFFFVVVWYRFSIKFFNAA